MFRASIRRRAVGCVLAAAGCCGLASAAPESKDAPAVKVPITTSSEEARKLYLQGRDLAEKLRATDARRLYEQAVAKDKDFALAHLGLANTAGTAKEFFDATTRAVAVAARVSEGERHIILAAEAGAKSNPAGQAEHLTQLTRAFPGDERAQNLLGLYHFGRQEYAAAVAQFEKAVAINPAFSAPYNQLGYAYRFLEKYPEAEKTFKKYIELIPNDPNPYDSYAELLMKMGRFDDSIKNYEKALAIDPNFVASYVGIGNDQMFSSRSDAARASFAKLAGVARNNGERRQAQFWTGASYVHEGADGKAIDELKKMYALAEADQDLAAMSGDLNQMGDVLREAGKADEALAKYAESVAVMNKANVPEEVRETTRRNNVFEEGRVALVKQDLATAKTKAAEYTKQVAAKAIPFEVRQQHELAGLIALAEKRHAAAVAELKQANQQDPRVLYLTAVALQGAGDAAGARAAAGKAANFNALGGFNYAFVRQKARLMAGS